MEKKKLVEQLRDGSLKMSTYLEELQKILDKDSQTLEKLTGTTQQLTKQKDRDKQNSVLSEIKKVSDRYKII